MKFDYSWKELKMEKTKLNSVWPGDCADECKSNQIRVKQAEQNRVNSFTGFQRTQLNQIEFLIF